MLSLSKSKHSPGGRAQRRGGHAISRTVAVVFLRFRCRRPRRRPRLAYKGLAVVALVLGVLLHGGPLVPIMRSSCVPRAGHRSRNANRVKAAAPTCYCSALPVPRTQCARAHFFLSLPPSKQNAFSLTKSFRANKPARPFARCCQSGPASLPTAYRGPSRHSIERALTLESVIPLFKESLLLVRFK